jgi:hypothetical protein
MRAASGASGAAVRIEELVVETRGGGPIDGELLRGRIGSALGALLARRGLPAALERGELGPRSRVSAELPPGEPGVEALAEQVAERLYLALGGAPAAAEPGTIAEGAR